MYARVSRLRMIVVGIAMLLTAASLPVHAADPPPALQAEPPKLDVGNVERDSRFYDYFVVENSSTQTVTISGISVTKPSTFSLSVVNGCRGALLPGTTCPIYVDGRVRGVGIYAATLKLFSDDPRSPLVLKVRALVPDAGAPVMQGGPQPGTLLRAWQPPKHLARLRWYWRASDDHMVSGFTTQMRIGKGSWKTLVKPAAQVDGESQHRDLTMPTGKAVTLRTRAHDPAGNKSAWASRTVRVSYRDIRPGRVLTGAWRNVEAKKAFGGDVVVTRELGATATITATARSIVLLGRKGPRQGYIRYTDEQGQPHRARLDANRNMNLQVVKGWYWESVATRRVTVTADTDWRDPFVTLDAWLIVK